MAATLTAVGGTSLAPAGKFGLTITDAGAPTDISSAPVIPAAGSKIVTG